MIKRKMELVSKPYSMVGVFSQDCKVLIHRYEKKKNLKAY